MGKAQEQKDKEEKKPTAQQILLESQAQQALRLVEEQAAKDAEFKAEAEAVSKDINLHELIIEGITRKTFKALLPGGLDVTFRTLTPKQERALNRDVRLFQQGKYVIRHPAAPGSPAYEEKFSEGDTPGELELAGFRCLRELAVLIDVIRPQNLPDDQPGHVFSARPIETNLAFLDDIPSLLLSEKVYPKALVFLAAVRRALNPQTPQEEAETLGKS